MLPNCSASEFCPPSWCRSDFSSSIVPDDGLFERRRSRHHRLRSYWPIRVLEGSGGRRCRRRRCGRGDAIENEGIMTRAGAGIQWGVIQCGQTTRSSLSRESPSLVEKMCRNRIQSRVAISHETEWVIAGTRGWVDKWIIWQWQVNCRFCGDLKWIVISHHSD